MRINPFLIYHVQKSVECFPGEIRKQPFVGKESGMIGISGVVSFRAIPIQLNRLSKKMQGSFCSEQIISADITQGPFSVQVLDEEGNNCVADRDGVSAIIAGDIYEDDFLGSEDVSKAEFLCQAYRAKGIDACVGLNGSYVFLLYDKHNRTLYLGMDQNAFIPLYYSEVDGIFYFSWDIEPILKVLPAGASLEDQNLMTWLLIGGRGFFDQTRFKGVKRLEPGSYVALTNDEIKLTRSVPFHYSPDGSTEERLLDRAAESMVRAVRRQVSGGGRILIGLSGGLDSRIILAAGIEVADTDWICYTYGRTRFAERDIAVQVAKHYKLPHIGICCDDLVYLRYANDGIFYSGGASIFKHGVQHHMFATLKAKYNSRGLMMGSALDLMLGSTHSPESVYELNDRNELLHFYEKAKQVGDIKNFLRFNLSNEMFCSLFHDAKQGKTFWESAIDTLKQCIGTIPGDHPVDINDALAMDIRIKRWYNYNLIYALHSHRLLTPTYDKEFMNVASRVPWQLRKDSQFRIKLLSRLDREISQIPFNATMQPAWLLPPYTHQFEKLQEEIDKVRQHIWFSSGKTVYLPSNRFDANFLEWFRIYPEYQAFLSSTLTGKDSVLCNLFFKKERIQNLIDRHIEGKENYQKFLQMLVSAELMCQIFIKGDKVVNRCFGDLSECFSD